MALPSSALLCRRTTYPQCCSHRCNDADGDNIFTCDKMGGASSASPAPTDTSAASTDATTIATSSTPQVCVPTLLKTAALLARAGARACYGRRAPLPPAPCCDVGERPTHEPPLGAVCARLARLPCRLGPAGTPLSRLSVDPPPRTPSLSASISAARSRSLFASLL